MNNYSPGGRPTSSSRRTPGDQLFLFGFSRGAYTVRSVAGLVCDLGILKPASMRHFDEIFRIYRRKPAEVSFNEFECWTNYLREHNPERYTEITIQVIGVWDTVGSLGVPDIHWFDLSGFRRRHQFHNTSLHPRKPLLFYIRQVINLNSLRNKARLSSSGARRKSQGI